MRVLFLKHVINVWKPWEIKEVKTGYASNMLIPQGLAVEMTPEAEKKHLEKIKREEKRRMSLIENRHSIVDELNWKRLEFSLKTWENWKIFWWVNENDIINSIKKNFKLELDRKHIDMPDWIIKKLGEHYIYIKLGKDSMAKMIVFVKNL